MGSVLQRRVIENSVLLLLGRGHENSIAKEKPLDWPRDQINERLLKTLLRMFRESPGRIRWGLGAGHYSAIAGASPATTTLELSNLAEKARSSAQESRNMHAIG